MSAKFTKDPAERLDYTWDWTPWLAEIGDTISEATVVPTEGLTVVGEPTVDGALVTQRVEGGVLGDFSVVTCQITTASGLIAERSIHLTIADR